MAHTPLTLRIARRGDLESAVVTESTRLDKPQKVDI